MSAWQHYQENGKNDGRNWRGPGLYTFTGSQTIFGENLYPDHKTWCGWNPKDEPGLLSVGLDSRFIYGTSPNSPNCGRCICIRLKGADRERVPNAPADAEQHAGKVWKGKIIDQCGGCQDQQLNIYSGDYYRGQLDYNLAMNVGIWKVDWGFTDCNAACY